MGERIQNDRWVVEIEPALGGRIGKMTADGTDLLIGRDDVPVGRSSVNWGSYPMVPWAGRIRRGRFVFEGRTIQLPIDFGPHAIHGVGKVSAWTVTDHRDGWIDLELALPDDMRWPFGGVARQHLTLDREVLRMELSVTAGERPFPATLGWHPWFRKPEALHHELRQMYQRDETDMTTDQLVDVPAPPWDGCFLNERPIVVTIDGTTIELTSDCDHWVVYDEPPHATCIEPQTGPPDAPNIRPRIVAPGATLSAWYRLVIVDRKPA